MPSRGQPPSDPATAQAIGELTGQLREIIHGLNSQAMKSDARDQKLAKLENVPTDIVEIKERLTALETSEHRREGATGLIQAILKSPTLGWIVGAVTTIWAFVTGRLTL